MSLTQIPHTYDKEPITFDFMTLKIYDPATYDLMTLRLSTSITFFKLFCNKTVPLLSYGYMHRLATLKDH